MSFFENTRKPDGIGGKIMVSVMNMGHKAMADWGFQFLEIPEEGNVLDCGCGGGANIERILREHPQTVVKGIDYSEVSVEKSQKVNQKEIDKGRCQILQASVMELPFTDEQFDLVTAFETIYFWPDLPKSFQEVYRVIKAGGTFFICNECNGDTDKDDKWMEKIPGMTIYKDSQIESVLLHAGFHDVKINKNDKGWISITAKK
nr:class I SAM-dependent methyltransferase [uncultured Blautia sp.]